MAKRSPRNEPPDFHLWAEVARTVTPLRPPPPKPLRSLAEGTLPVPAAQPAPRPQRLAPAMPSYQSDGRPGYTPRGQVIEPRMRRRLGRGQIGIDGTIDLHGMRQAEAHSALVRFVRARAGRGDRTLLVVTGKGLTKADADAQGGVERGVLRTMLPFWLSTPELAPLVAGWDVAAPGHGGAGAYYVRLRREARR